MLLSAIAAPEPYGKALFRALLSVIFSYDPIGWGLPYSHSIVSDSHGAVMHTATQLLLVLLSQPGGSAPTEAPAPATPDSAPAADKASKLLVGLQRGETLAFLVEGFARLLRTDMVSQSTYLPSSIAALDCQQELIVLLWKFITLNRHFLAALLANPARLHDVILSLCHYILIWVDDVAKSSMLHLSTLCLLLLSGEKAFITVVNLQCPRSLPHLGRSPAACTGTFADLLVACVAEVILSAHERLECIYPALLALLTNIAPHAKQYLYSTANLMLQMLSSLGSPDFLLTSPQRPEYLIALVEVLTASLLYHHQTNLPLLQLILLNEQLIRALPRMRLSEDPAGADPAREDPAATAATGAVQPPQPSSEPERPSGSGFSPTNEWIQSWQARLNIRPILLTLDTLLPKLSPEQLALDVIPEILKSTSLVGALPPPPAVAVRCYSPNEFSDVWLTQVIWGVVYSRNQHLYDAAQIKLVQIMRLE
uniref:Dymeclin n=1 Tax=Haptolina ericina TaxID=156174 RepID=A0A7S3BE63_9EUKA